MTCASIVAGVFSKTASFVAGALNSPAAWRAKRPDSAIRQRDDRRLFQALVVEIAELEFQLVKFRRKFFKASPRRKCPSVR